MRAFSHEPPRIMEGEDVDHRSYWLELCAPEELRPAPFAMDIISVARLRGAERERARLLWREVGRGFWTEREEWTSARWGSHLDAARTWFGAATSSGGDVGFFELTRAAQETIERTMRSFEIYVAAAAIYFLLCFPLTRFAERWEARLLRP